MVLSNYSEHFYIILFILFLASGCTLLGSMWIERLYPKAQLRDSLSFPEQITERAKFRKPGLFLSFIICFYMAFMQLSFPKLGYILAAIVFLLLVTVTDFEQHVILNEMLLAFALVGLCCTLHLQLPLANHLLAAIGGGLLFFFLAVISKGAIGGGDIKLIAALGLWFEWKLLLSVILYGAIAGGVAALVLLLTKKIKRKQFLAYGPYFTLSAIGIMVKLLRVLF